MEIPILTYADYLTSDTYTRNEEFAACKFVKCIKGEKFQGYATVSDGKGWVKLQVGDRSKAVNAFALLASKRFTLIAPTIFVPIPGSKTHIQSQTPSPMFDVATAIAAQFNLAAKATVASAQDILAWDQVMTSAHHGGGPRSPELLYPHLTARIQLTHGMRVILVDDVMTTGGHIRACAAFLENKFSANVVATVCLGRTVDISSASPLGWQDSILPRYFPV